MHVTVVIGRILKRSNTIKISKFIFKLGAIACFMLEVSLPVQSGKSVAATRALGARAASAKRSQTIAERFFLTVDTDRLQLQAHMWHVYVVYWCSHFSQYYDFLKIRG